MGKQFRISDFGLRILKKEENRDSLVGAAFSLDFCREEGAWGDNFELRISNFGFKKTEYRYPFLWERLSAAIIYLNDLNDFNDFNGFNDLPLTTDYWMWDVKCEMPNDK